MTVCDYILLKKHITGAVIRKFPTACKKNLLSCNFNYLIHWKKHSKFYIFWLKYTRTNMEFYEELVMMKIAISLKMTQALRIEILSYFLIVKIAL